MDEQIKNLAETLKKNGMAASMYEAIEKAKSILNVKSDEKNTPQQNPEIKDGVPLNELMKEVGVTSEQVEAQEQEKIEDTGAEIMDIKRDLKEAEKNPEKIEQIKEEIKEVKEEVEKLEEEQTEEEPQEPKSEEDLFKEEKKIDLTKVFNNKQ